MNKHIQFLMSLVLYERGGGIRTAAVLPPLATPRTIDIPTIKPVGSGAVVILPILRDWRLLRF